LAEVSAKLAAAKNAKRYIPPPPIDIKVKDDIYEAGNVPNAKPDQLISRANIPSHASTPVVPVVLPPEVPEPTVAPRAPVLLSRDHHVVSSVRGNLGPAAVVTSERMDDWLADRWQAARNMGGDPIPGQHWLIVDLVNASTVERVLIDWEVALSNDYTLEGCNVALNAFSNGNADACSRCNAPRTQQWRPIAARKDFVETGRSQHHIVHESNKFFEATASQPYRCIKLAIRRPATRFGSSVWRLQVWGQPHGGGDSSTGGGLRGAPYRLM